MSFFSLPYFHCCWIFSFLLFIYELNNTGKCKIFFYKEVEYFFLLCLSPPLYALLQRLLCSVLHRGEVVMLWPPMLYKYMSLKMNHFTKRKEFPKPSFPFNPETVWSEATQVSCQWNCSHFVPVLQWKALEFRALYEETLCFPSARQISTGSHKIISKWEWDFKWKKTYQYI